MKQTLVKISLIALLLCCFTSCNVVKRVEDDQHLLTEVNVNVNGKKTSKEEITNLVYQQPNDKLLGYPLRLHVFNLARPNIDSIIQEKILNNPRKLEWKTKTLSRKQLNKQLESKRDFNAWIKRTGEAPVIVDSVRTLKSQNRLEQYYYSNGWFDREVNYIIERNDKKRAKVDYFVQTGNPYLLDSLSYNIASPLIDSLFQRTKSESFIKSGNQFRVKDFDNERQRLVSNFRNSGVYHFTLDYISYDIDTLLAGEKVNVDLKIGNRIIRNEDSIARVPFKVYKIKKVNIITDDNIENRGRSFNDSIQYNNYTLYAFDKVKYRPKALVDAIFINKDSIYRDIDRTRTSRYLNELRTFRYPTVEYIENTEDTTLTANIFLRPRKKYGLGFEFNVSQSNIQSIGLSASASLLARNVFKGAETLEFSLLGTIAASKEANRNESQFFDINEFGGDLKLTIPRLFFPIQTDKIIPKYMSPTTRISVGITGQTNIGLDKQTFNSALNYRWLPSERTINGFDLFNVQYIRNLNPENYFEVYRNSYDTLNEIAMDEYNTPPEFLDEDGNLIESEADEFMDLVLADDDFLQSNPDEYQTVSNINERKDRLTENNLIFSTTFSYTLDKRENIFDKSFSIFRFKGELAGNLLSSIANLVGADKNANDQFELFNVPYSQYIKTEFDYIKHWDLGSSKELALRTFFGIAIPYGNSTNIPFAKSFFAGGPNDNRAWAAYDLGPGSSSSNNEFNEANMKIALSLEYRFNIFGRLNGALFADAGNIWNVFDDVADPGATFEGFSSFQDIALGSGFGIRYDINFFVVRFDIGFRAYDPSFPLNNRWFNEFNFANAVYNIGINYPF